MIFLKVAYADKDEAKALGARWNPTRKAWYIPDGKASEPFARWILDGGAAPATGAKPTGSGSRDAYAALPVVGKQYVAIEHACNPFTSCPRCQPILIESGWLEAQQVVRRMLAAL